MAVYASSLGDEPSLRADADVDQTAFEHVLDVMIDPALEMCDAAALEKKRLRPKWDREVFGLNCLTYLQVKGLSVCVCQCWFNLLHRFFF